MTTERREYLRQIMALAWQKLRCEHRWAPGRPYGMAEALRHAWAWFKGAAAREAARAAAEAEWNAQGRSVTHLRSTARSPIGWALRGQRYAGTEAHRAAYTTARLGY